MSVRASQGKTVPNLTRDDLTRFGEAVEAQYGLYFPEKRWPDLERGVSLAFAASTCQDLDEYYQILEEQRDGGLEMDRLLNALTVGETYFFRDAGQFDALYHHVLPQIIERRKSVRTLRIWSAGCASGEEPYSMAMMLHELLPDVNEWAITILGTDINTGALDRARKGLYSEWAFREERARQWRPRYFDHRDGRWALDPRVKRMVTFRRLNLASNNYPAYETNTSLMDLILCRNVTIYFSGAATQNVVNRMYDALVDGGWFIVGHSEPSPITYQRFESRTFPNAVLYRRTGQPAALPKAWKSVDDDLRVQRVQPSHTASATSAAPPLPPQSQPTPPPPRPSQGDTPSILDAPQDVGADLRACPRDPVERAADLLEYGYSERARDLLLENVEQQACAPVAATLLGQAYANLGDWPEAERWCREAIRLDKLTLEAYYTLALVLQHQAQLDKAIEAMKKVVYIDRHYVLGHFGLADMYRNRGQWPQAQKALDNARRLLDALPSEELIPGSGGVTVGRLSETVNRQQQQIHATRNAHVQENANVP